jgi:hypothetical protein
MGEMLRAGWEVKSALALTDVDFAGGLDDGHHHPPCPAGGRRPGVRARYARPLDGGGFVAVGKGEMAWVEASLPKRRGSWESLALGDALAEVSAMVEDACQFVTPTGRWASRQAGHRDPDVSADDAKIIRLDTVRELRLTEPAVLSPLLEGLGNVHHAGRVKTRRYADPSRGQAETLSVGPKAWKGTLYDKHEETKTWRPAGDNLRVSPAPAGSLRAEFRLHGAQLRSVRSSNAGGFIARVSNLEEAKVRNLTRTWWDLCGFGREVAGAATLAQLVMSQTDWSETRRRMLLSYLEHPEFPFENRNTERKYRNLAESLGLVIGRQNDFSVRLDYDAGREVVVPLRAA